MGSSSVKGTKRKSLILNIQTSVNKKESKNSISGKNKLNLTKTASSNSLSKTRKSSSSLVTNILSYEKNIISKLTIETNINFKNEKEDYKIINTSLSNHYLFKYVDNDSLKKIINKLI